MELYRVECTRDSDFSTTSWTTSLKKAKMQYDTEKDTWYDDEAFEDDTITLVKIDVPEEVFEEFEDDQVKLQEHVLAVDPDDDDEEGYVSSYWLHKVKLDQK